MIRVPLLDLKAQYAPLREEIRAAMDRVCDAQGFILGPEVEALEKEIAWRQGWIPAARVRAAADGMGSSAYAEYLRAQLKQDGSS